LNLVQFRHDCIGIKVVCQNLVQDGEHLLPLFFANSATDFNFIITSSVGDTARPARSCFSCCGRLGPATKGGQQDQNKTVSHGYHSFFAGFGFFPGWDKLLTVIVFPLPVFAVLLSPFAVASPVFCVDTITGAGVCGAGTCAVAGLLR
jgi:hypothetical protein